VCALSLVHFYFSIFVREEEREGCCCFCFHKRFAVLKITRINNNNNNNNDKE